MPSSHSHALKAMLSAMLSQAWPPLTGMASSHRHGLLSQACSQGHALSHALTAMPSSHSEPCSHRHALAAFISVFRLSESRGVGERLELTSSGLTGLPRIFHGPAKTIEKENRHGHALRAMLSHTHTHSHALTEACSQGPCSHTAMLSRPCSQRHSLTAMLSG